MLSKILKEKNSEGLKIRIWKNPTDKSLILQIQNFCQLDFFISTFLWSLDFFHHFLIFFTNFDIFYIQCFSLTYECENLGNFLLLLEKSVRRNKKIVYANIAIQIFSCRRLFIPDIAIKTEKTACFVTLLFYNFLQRKNIRNGHSQFLQIFLKS